MNGVEAARVQLNCFIHFFLSFLRMPPPAELPMVRLYNTLARQRLTNLGNGLGFLFQRRYKQFQNGK
jgi:hypothetical protein